MRFSDIPIRGVRVEVDHWVLGQFILERFEDEFGTEQILGVDPESYPGEYFVDVNVKNTTPEILEFSDKLEEELQEKGINVVIMSKSADGNIQP
jgi:hypothetical protein